MSTITSQTLRRVDPLLTGKVLVVDADHDVRRVIRCELLETGFEVIEATDGASAVAAIEQASPDLVILEMTPAVAGRLEVLDAIRSGALGPRATPVIVLSSRNTEADLIAGLDQGADDYVIKPFSVAELGARVRCLLRRSSASPLRTRIETGPVRIDLRTRSVRMTGREVNLTSKEFDLLAFLAAHAGDVFSRAELLERVWHSAQWRGEATVTEHVYRVRAKLGIDSAHPRLLSTVRGVGYRWDAPPD